MEEIEPRLDFDALVPRFSAAMSRLDAAGVGELAKTAVGVSFAEDSVKTALAAEIDEYVANSST